MSDDRGLRDSLAQSLTAATSSADHLRGQRDDVTTKIRFGLVGLNGGSVLAAIAALGGNTAALERIGISLDQLASAIIFFLVGAVVAGVALFQQQNHLVVAAGEANARAIRYAMAVHHANVNPGGDDLGALLKVIAAQTPPEATYSKAAIWFQSFGGALWLGGCSVIVMDVVRDHLPTISAMWPWT